MKNIKTIVLLKYNDKLLYLFVKIEMSPLRIGDTISVPFNYFSMMSRKIGKKSDKIGQYSSNRKHIVFTVKKTYLKLNDNFSVDENSYIFNESDTDFYNDDDDCNFWHTELEILKTDENKDILHSLHLF